MHHQMPTPTDAHRKLARLAGTWRIEETMFPSPWDAKGGTAVGHSEVAVILDGFYVQTTYHQERGGVITYRGLGVFGFDTQSARYTMVWLDNMGAGCGVTPALGTFEGERLVFEHAPFPGMSVRYVYDFEGDASYRFRLENSADGGKTWVPFIEGLATRK